MESKFSAAKIVGVIHTAMCKFIMLHEIEQVQSRILQIQQLTNVTIFIKLTKKGAALGNEEEAKEELAA